MTSRQAYAAHDLATKTTTLHVGGLHYASEKAVVERVLARQPGVLEVDANPVAQTASVTFDPTRTSVDDLPLRRAVDPRPRLRPTRTGRAAGTRP
jgi:copper chaperone CopZ